MGLHQNNFQSRQIRAFFQTNGQGMRLKAQFSCRNVAKRKSKVNEADL